MPHLFIAVTAHGYGHLAQVAPIAQALTCRLPGLRITLQGTLAPAVVAARLPKGYRHLHEDADVALPMAGPLEVRWEEGLARYAAFDAEHERHLAHERDLLAADPPDLLLADAPWIPLIAARELGIPGVGLCSLSWLDILEESRVGARLPGGLVAHMRDGYAGAELFIRPAPSMPMAWLPNGRDIGPIAVHRPREPEVVRKRLGVAQEKRLALVQFGGAGHLPLGKAEPLPEWLQLVTPDRELAAAHSGFRLVGGPGLNVPDVLAACDAVITKPGYGTFAEAACNGIPVLYVPRSDWPEAPHLVDWLGRQVPAAPISAAEFIAGRIGRPLGQLLDTERTAPVPASGVDEAAELLLPYLV